MSTTSRAIAGTRVRVQCAEHLVPLAGDILVALTGIAAVDRPHAGLRIRFGWSVLTLEDDGPGGLVVCEPDFAGDPLRDVVPRVDTTLEVIAGQTALARRVRVTPADVGFEQYVVTARGVPRAETLTLFRSAPRDEEDSGWSIVSSDTGAASENPDDYEAVQVYRFLTLRRAVLSALILPPEYAAVLTGGQITAVLDPSGRDRLAEGGNL